MSTLVEKATCTAGVCQDYLPWQDRTLIVQMYNLLEVARHHLLHQAQQSHVFQASKSGPIASRGGMTAEQMASHASAW